MGKRRNRELIFYVSENTELVTYQKNGDRKYNFLCRERKKGNLQKCEDDPCFLLDLLKSFLESVQNNVDNLIIDAKLGEEEKQVFRYYNQRIYLSNLVGVVAIRNHVFQSKLFDATIQICTRLDAGISDNSIELGNCSDNIFNPEKPYFLNTLLFGEIQSLSNSFVKSSDDYLSNLLLFSFIEKYKEAYATKGYFKNYHSFKGNDYKLKGSIDIARHINLNAGLNNGKVAYSYKEKSENNFLNHLIVEAYECLKRKNNSQANQVLAIHRDLKESLESLKYIIKFPEYSRRILISKNINSLSNPYFTEYEDLRRICIKILRNEGLSPISGSQHEEVEGILMYVPRLWEKFIEKYLSGVSYKAQDEIKVFSAMNNGVFGTSTFPDYVFYEGKRPFMILDAKFKPGWLNAVKTGNISDILRPDYDKCLRDMVSINSSITGVIFPVKERIEYCEDGFMIDNQKYYYMHSISEYNTRTEFFTFPVSIPEITGNYEAWRIALDRQNSYLFSIISKIIRAHKPIV